MRLRPAFAIALLILCPVAPARAAQIPAQEVEFLEVSDPYGVFPGLAVRTIAGSHIYVVQPSTFHLQPASPFGVAGFWAELPELGIAAYDAIIPQCANYSSCLIDRAINRAGRVVGIEVYNQVPSHWTRPFTYRRVGGQPGYLEFEYLALPPGYPAPPTLGAEVSADAISEGGQIAGTARSSNPAVGLAPIWWSSPSAVPLELPRLPGANAGPFPVRLGSVYNIIVGVTGGSAPQRAAVWRGISPGTYTLMLLGELPGGTSSRVYDISFFGGIVGSSDDGTGTHVAVMWKWNDYFSEYAVTPLPVPENGSCSAATAINTAGDIAGNCILGSGAERGVVWRKVGLSYELLHELAPLPGHTRSVAYALDNDGRAGGGSGPAGQERAVLWPVVVAAPPSVPALSHGALLCLAAVIAVATAATLRAR